MTAPFAEALQVCIDRPRVVHATPGRRGQKQAPPRGETCSVEVDIVAVSHAPEKGMLHAEAALEHAR